MYMKKPLDRAFLLRLYLGNGGFEIGNDYY